MRCFLLRPLFFATFVAALLIVFIPITTFCANYSDSLSSVYRDKGFAFYDKGNYAKADEFFFKSVKLYLSTKHPDSATLGARYYMLGCTKQLLGYTDSALYYYSSAVNCLKQVKSSQPDLAMTYVEMGNCYLARHDLQEAISYMKQGIAILSDLPGRDNHMLVVAWYKLSNALTQLARYSEAKTVSVKSITLAQNHDPKMLSAIYNGLGNTCLAEKNYADALHYYKQAEHCFYLGQFNNDEDAYSVNNNIGLLYFKKKDWPFSLLYLEKSLLLSRNSKVAGPAIVAQILVNIGKVKAEQGEYSNAIRRFQEALAVLQKPSARQGSGGQLKRGLFSRSLAADINQDLGDTYLSLYHKTHLRKNALASLGYYRQAVLLVEELRLGLFGEEDKLALSERFNKVFDKAVGAAMLLAGFDSKYADAAFQFASKGKAAVLSESLRRVSGLSLAGVPSELQDRERQMRRRIGGLSELVYEEQKKNSPSVANLEGALFGEQERYRQLLKSIETKYPKYYSLKFDTSSVSISAIQSKLKRDQLYIEYVIHGSILYSFAISCDQVKWKTQRIGKDFYRNLNTFQVELVPRDFGSLNTANLNRFVESSYYLYSKLIQPFSELLSGKTLVVVPHNELVSIPFCALVTSTPSNPSGYYALPYLVKSNPILISLSSKAFVSTDFVGPSLFASSLSVAPSYKGHVKQALANRSAYRENLSELYGAEGEVKWVSNVFGGDLLVGKDATETNFKKKAEGYDVLHLAMHTSVDEKNPFFSKLIFYNSIDGVNDGYLNAYEVYGMQMKARLAILSACRSGDGALVKGEGLMSLSRAFLYAGCPSMVVTQWRVDDFSGSEVMKRFAVALKGGCSKSSALRRAQLEFLNNSDPLRSHPYFWAGYQVIGSDNPVFVSVWQIVTPLVLGLLLVLQFVGINYRRPWC